MAPHGPTVHPRDVVHAGLLLLHGGGRRGSRAQRNGLGRKHRGRSPSAGCQRHPAVRMHARDSDLHDGHAENRWQYAEGCNRAKGCHADRDQSPGDDAEIPSGLQRQVEAVGSPRNPWHARRFLEHELEMLNNEQQHIFYLIRKWCIDKRDKAVEPICIYVNGSGGVGKSHLIRCIVYEANKILEPLKRTADDVQIVTLAPTGTAAHNIGGSTLHSFFHFPPFLAMPYIPLGESVLNTLRCKLEKLSIIIIDEVSMVSSVMLSYIHGRLSQITQNSAAFGNITILAFGDFHQLPPVKGAPLYRNDGFGLWQDNFKITTLSKIMRQENLEFAEMLNRLRVLQKGCDLNEGDKTTLLERAAAKSPDDALHVYAKNKDVDDRNIVMLHRLSSDIVIIKATDFVTSRGKTYKKKSNIAADGLPHELKLSVGAKVMLQRNIDVSDGLVNGAMGVITAFVMDQNKTETPVCICIKFDNARVGKRAIQDGRYGPEIPTGSVCIYPFDEQFHSGKIRRRQFPLKLAFASTIHKTQGMTVDRIVVSMKSMFSAGMAYVALSRVTDVNGLYLTDFDTKKHGIFCNNDVEIFLRNMHPLDLSVVLPLTASLAADLVVIHHNVEGIQNHKNAITKSSHLIRTSVFLATETWIQSQHHATSLTLPGFSMMHRTREDCSHYQGGNTTKGGVACAVRLDLKHTFISLSNECENVAVLLPDYDCIIICAYRSPNYPIAMFVKHMKFMLQQPIVKSVANILIAGDFNEDLLQNRHWPVFHLLFENGFKQLVNDPTTSGGTLLDVMYFRGNMSVKNAGVMQSYYSYHEPTFVICSRT